MRRPTGPTGREALSEITQRLGALMGEVKTAFEQADAARSQDGENAREFTIETPAGPLKGMTSFRVGSVADRVGAAGGASASRNASQHEMKKKPAAAEVDDAREPLVDVFDEATEIMIVAELPGVKPDEVTVTIEDGSVIIATSGQRRFRAVRALPAAVDEGTLTRAMRNGILEVRVAKTGAVA
jgi:HSP20 family molecular chaperone IbpA